MGSPIAGFAESYLFPTEVLPVGKIDVLALIQKNTIAKNVSGDIVGVPLKIEQQRDTVTEYVGVRYGLLPNLQIGIETSYRSQDELKTESRPGSALMGGNKEKSDGANNLGLFARYRLLNQLDPRFSLVANAGVEADTANRNYTALNLGLTGGWRFNDAIRGYAGYSAFLSDEDTLSSSHSLLTGVYIQVNPVITLVPQYRFTRYEEAHFHSFTRAPTRDGQSISLAVHVRVLPNSYLIPYAGFDYLEGYKDDLNIKNHDSHDGMNYGLSFYHVF